MDEKEFLITTFRENFKDSLSEKTVIYGISHNTEILLEAFPQLNVCGLLDGFITDGNMYGYPVITLDTVLDLQVKRIVIVARAASIKIILKRIYGFSVTHGIHVYDINGVDLIHKYESMETDDPYFKISYEQLKESIDAHEVISFDLFDTIWMRKTLHPTDIFEIIEKRLQKKEPALGEGFAAQRIRAERELLGGKYPDIDAIYERFAANTGISLSEANHLKSFEFSVEKEMLVPRKRMVEAYHYAIQRNKKVYFVSDMYYTKPYLKEMLQMVGVVEYEDVFVSSKYGVMKGNGLFDILKEHIGNASCLHIGDNPESDIAAANRFELDAFRIANAVDLLDMSSYRGLNRFMQTLSEKNALGLFIAKIFNDPFRLYASKGIVSVDSPEEFAYAYVGPIITSYMYWLFDKLKENSCDTMLFLARDGYLIKKLYDMAAIRSKGQLPESKYFLTSRFPCIVCGIFDEQDIKRVYQIGYNGTPDHLLRNRYLLNDDEIDTYPEGQDVFSYVMQHKERILSRAKKMRESYRTYAALQGVDEKHTYGVFDLAASGTCQITLQKLLHITCTGYYFVHIEDEAKKGLAQIDSLFHIRSWMNKEAFICESYILLESMITSFVPSVKSFTEDGSPLYVTENRTKKQLEQLEDIQRGIYRYYKDALDMDTQEGIPYKMADAILSLIQKKYTELDIASLTDGKLSDEFFNRSYSFGDILA
jgi:FMN phosphatase YigB (HAD superfamily)